MRIVMTGATGLIGGALSAHFRARGDEVTVVSRRARPDVVVWDPDAGAIDVRALEGHDVAIHLAGESIAGVWTPRRKRRIRQSRVAGTQLFASTLARLDARPRVLLSASAMGIYGHDHGARPIDERTPPGSGFFPETGVAWERAAEPAAEAGIRVVYTRFGNVLSPDGGFLAALLPFFRLGLGMRFGSGDGYWPWVALDELPHVADHLIAHEDVAGPVNVVAPEPATNDELTRAIADALGRPRPLVLPAFLLRLAPGGMADEVLLISLRLVPARLAAGGYAFREPQLRPLLQRMLGGARAA